MEHAGLDTIDRLIADFLVGFVVPPDEHVGVHQDVLGETVFRLVECCGAHAQVSGGAQTLGNRAMNPVRINGSVAFVLSFVPVFVPNGDRSDSLPSSQRVVEDWLDHNASTSTSSPSSAER